MAVIGVSMSDENISIVNLSYLEEYTDNDPESLAELIGVFYETFSGDLDMLEKNITDGENKEWSQIAHKLKGSSGFIGAEKLKILCASAQNMQTASLDERRSIYQRIKEAYGAVCIFLQGEFKA